MTMILVLAHVDVGAQVLDEALDLSRAHVARSRAEPGCLEHGVHRDGELPHRLRFIERWESMAALQAHFAVPASRRFVRDLSALAAAPPSMTLYEACEVSPASPPQQPG
jgi:quinol monooxygenase YgiN